LGARPLKARLRGACSCGSRNRSWNNNFSWAYRAAARPWIRMPGRGAVHGAGL